jgi:hypothetical protein
MVRGSPNPEAAGEEDHATQKCTNWSPKLNTQPDEVHPQAYLFGVRIFAERFDIHDSASALLKEKGVNIFTPGRVPMQSG